MTQPVDGPATRDAVKRDLRMGAGAEDAAVDEVVAAVNSRVRGWPVAALTGPDPEDWPAHVTRGANMLAARLYRRRESPAGVAAFGDQGPVYVQRNDPDVAMLLRLGAYQRPEVG